MANDEVYGLYGRDIERLERGLRRLEAMSQGGGIGSGSGPVHYESFFWAKITAKEPSTGYKYSWEHIRWSDRDHETKPNELIVYQQGRTTSKLGAAYNDENHHYAVEMNKSTVVPLGSYVLMHNIPNQPYLVFDYGTPVRWFKVGGTAITAATYDGTPIIGSGDATLQKFTVTSGNLQGDTDHTTAIKIWNPSTVEITEDTYVRCQHDKAAWVVVWEDCE